MAASIQDMCIDHRGRHVLVSEEFLDRPNVVPVFKKMGCEGMAKRVATGRLGDSSLASGFFDGLLNDGFMQVMSVLFAGHRMGVIPGSRERPLPAPLSARLGILAIQRIREDDAA